MSEYLSKEEVEFEIAFFNGIIEKNQNFAEALIALGDLYTKAGLIQEGLAIDERLVQLRPSDPIAFYNLACSYSLMGDIDKAFRSVKKAINCGYSDFLHMERDVDLSNLRKDKRFQQYIARVKNRKASGSVE
jgi:tetratricopeptide (TPR) repeat protein